MKSLESKSFLWHKGLLPLSELVLETPVISKQDITEIGITDSLRLIEVLRILC